MLADRALLGADGAVVLGACGLALGLVLPAGPRRRAACAGVVALAAGALSLGRQLEAAGVAPAAAEQIVEGEVARVARWPHGWEMELARVRGEAGAVPPPARVLLRGEPTPPGLAAVVEALPGETLRARVRLRAPGGLRNPGLRERTRQLERAGVGASGRLVHPALHWRHGDERALVALHAARRRLGERLAAAGPGGGLLRALALGDRGDLPREASEAFARLGVAHLLAVSGLHLGLLTSLVYAGLRGLALWTGFAARRDPRPLALSGGLVVALGYALLSGWGVPVRRALVVLLALALSLARGRAGPRLQPLALAALGVLAMQPEALFAPGAQLSFAASAALAGAAARPEAPTGEPRRGWLHEALRASATALAVTAPLAALQLGSRAPLAPLANLLGIPWTAGLLLPAALLGTAAAALALPGADRLLGLCAGLAAWTLRGVEAAARHAPGAVGAPAPAPAALVAACLLAALALRARSTAVRLGLAAAIGVGLSLAPAAALAPPPPRLVVLDVGQADASLVQGRRASLLVDGASALPEGIDLGRSVVVPALRALGVSRLDLVVASHADLDHRGGLPAVLRRVPVGELWLPPGGLADPDFAELRAVARARGVPAREVSAGLPLRRLGDLRVQVLWPPAGEREGPRNDRSLVLRVELGEAGGPARRVLLPGDIEAEAEERLLASGADLRADVLKLAHHGSRSSSSAAFLAAVDAAVGIASAPCGGRFHMPHPEVRGRAAAAGLALWWTGRDGAVRVGLAGRLHVGGTGRARRCAGGR